MSTIIRTRSPYFIRTPEETDATLSYFSIIINIYDGSQLSSEPCSNYNVSYTLNKKPLGTENSVSFDISEIVNDSLNQEYNGNLSFSNSVKAQSLWVTITTSAKTSAGAPIGSATTTYYLAQEGYNKFKEGVNYTTQKTVLLSENYIVTVVDTNGCINSDTVYVELLPDITFPNGFSPNGDGINDFILEHLTNSLSSYGLSFIKNRECNWNLLFTTWNNISSYYFWDAYINLNICLSIWMSS